MTRSYLLLLCISAALAQTNVFNQLCANGVTCPSSPSFTVNGVAYSQSDLNAISFGDFTNVNGDVEGRVAVQGNYYASGSSVGYSLTNSTLAYSLIVGHDASFTNGEIYPADAGAFVGGSFSGSASLTTQVRANCSTSGCLDAQFANLKSYFTGVSSALAAMTANVQTSTASGVLTLSCSGSASIYYVSMSAADFSNVMSYTLGSNCSAGAYYVFNIQGSGSVLFQGANFPSYSVVYNVEAAATVSVSATVSGAVLAPTSNFAQATGLVIGQLIAGNVTSLNQVNLPGHPNASTTGSTTSTSTTGAVSTGSGSTTSGCVCPNPPASTTTGGCTPAPSTTPTPCIPIDSASQCGSLSGAINGDYTFTFVDYDFIAFGDLSANTGDIEGRAFVYGSVNVGNGFSFGQYVTANASEYNLIAGSVNFGSGSLSGGRGFSASSNVTAPSYLTSVFDGPCTSSDCLASIRSRGQSCYGSASSTLAAQDSNANYSLVNMGIRITCQSNSSSFIYVTVDGADISQSTWWSIDSSCSGSALLIVNIDGTGDVSFSGGNMPRPDGSVVYNVLGSGRTINVNTAVAGSILAPGNNLNMAGGVVMGKVVVNNAFVVQTNIPDCLGYSFGGSSGSLVSSGNSGRTSSAASMTYSAVLGFFMALFVALNF